MTSIEVPDWVVARARAAVREFWENYKGGCDCGEFDAAMKSALTAALGAWVVPAHFATDGAGDVPVFAEFTDLDQAYDYAGDDGWVIESYALRQEKPE